MELERKKLLWTELSDAFGKRKKRLYSVICIYQCFLMTQFVRLSIKEAA